MLAVEIPHPERIVFLHQIQMSKFGDPVIEHFLCVHALSQEVADGPAFKLIEIGGGDFATLRPGETPENAPLVECRQIPVTSQMEADEFEKLLLQALHSLQAGTP